MISVTLSRYMAVVFLRSIALVFGLVFTLIYMADFVEMLRRADDIKGATFFNIAYICLLRAPSITEKVIPFAMLFGSLATFLNLSRKLELVVVRAAGVSAYQFLLTPVLLAAILGLLAIGLYNPLAALAKQRADHMESKLFASQSGASVRSGLWIQQRSGDHQAIMRADYASDNGLQLTGISAFEFNPDGSFRDRVDAKSGILQPNHWELKEARVLVPGEPPHAHAAFNLTTNLNAAQVNQSFGDPDSTPFWSLRNLIQNTEEAGLDATNYRLHYQSLLAEPMLLSAMVLVAAVFSLRFFRLGGITRTVAGGIAAGFMLYITSVLVGSLGEAGVLSVWLAAWLPALMGGMLSTLALLYREDG